jgi:hypothetical protein
VTTIQGGQGGTTVRCAWLTDGAVLNGFTLLSGSAHGGGYPASLQNGGGVWANSVNATVVNCVITNNWAWYGGGAYQATLWNCVIWGNAAPSGGGGTYQSTLWACAVVANTSYSGSGAGVYNGYLFNCTVVSNAVSTGSGGGTFNVRAYNSIVFNNNALGGIANNAGGGIFSYTCTSPLPGGTGNIAVDPQLMDCVHLKLTSPCRGAGSSVYSSGADIDGETWSNPPSMGCDEVWESALLGPLSVGITPQWPAITQTRPLGLTGFVSGRFSRVDWSFGDGSIQTNSVTALSHIWTTPGNYQVGFTAYNTDNTNGVSAGIMIPVMPLVSPTLSVGPVSNNTFTSSFISQPGVSYEVDETTNLTPPISWQGIQWTFPSGGGQVQFTDPIGTNSSRFYRVRSR